MFRACPQKNRLALCRPSMQVMTERWLVQLMIWVWKIWPMDWLVWVQLDYRVVIQRSAPGDGCNRWMWLNVADGGVLHSKSCFFERVALFRSRWVIIPRPSFTLSSWCGEIGTKTWLTVVKNWTKWSKDTSVNWLGESPVQTQGQGWSVIVWNRCQIRFTLFAGSAVYKPREPRQFWWR